MNRFDQVPKTLNGHPVIAAALREGRNGPAERNPIYVVMVFRAADPMPYVVATWGAPTGNEWVWGHYHDSIQDAAERFAAMAQVPQNVN